LMISSTFQPCGQPGREWPPRRRRTAQMSFTVFLFARGRVASSGRSRKGTRRLSMVHNRYHRPPRPGSRPGLRGRGDKAARRWYDRPRTGRIPRPEGRASRRLPDRPVARARGCRQGEAFAARVQAETGCLVADRRNGRIVALGRATSRVAG
jgi:hypothetical protein